MPWSSEGRIVVLGTGQVGSALAHAGGTGVRVVGRDVLDVEDSAAIEQVLAALRPDVLINATAYNRVDEAERSPERAFAVNAIAPGRLARAATLLGARFVHMSTDYVFSGAVPGNEVPRPYREDDPPAPLGVYGTSKLAGELLVRAYQPSALVVRTSGVFGALDLALSPGQSGQDVARKRNPDASADGAEKGNPMLRRPEGDRRAPNFVEAIMRKAEAGLPLEVVADQIVGPTYAADLAEMLLELVTRRVEGVVHVTNAGVCSWYDFACTILELADARQATVRPVSSAARETAARRPAFSVLDHERLRALGLEMPHWRDALRRYLLEIGRVHMAADSEGPGVAFTPELPASTLMEDY